MGAVFSLAESRSGVVGAVLEPQPRPEQAVSAKSESSQRAALKRSHFFFRDPAQQSLGAEQEHEH